MSDADSLKVPFSRPSISEEESRAVLDVLNSGWLTTGKEALAFENEFSAFVNNVSEKVLARRKSAGFDARPVTSLAVNSNTSGMTLAMEACGVKAGRAVITTPYTFVSTAACAKHLGAEVLFADIEKDSYSIDAENVRRLLEADKDKKIAAIVPVHVAGNVCDMERLLALAKEFDVKVIEDAAHAFPSATSLGYAGTIGDAGVFSFYVTKTMTTAEGGMVCVRDKELSKRIQIMRMHGMDRTTWDRYTSPRASWEYDIVDLGWKFNLPDLLATLGRVQLKRAYEFFEKRKKIASLYNQAFLKLDFVELPPDGPGNAWHLYLCRLNLAKLKIDRAQFAKALQKEGIGISVHFIPLFNFTYWKKLCPGFNASNYPNAAAQYERTISLPLWPDMTEDMAYKTIAAVKKIGEENHA